MLLHSVVTQPAGSQPPPSWEAPAGSQPPPSWEAAIPPVDSSCPCFESILQCETLVCNSAFLIKAGVDRNGKTCTRAPLKMKRGVEGGRSPPCGGVGGGSAPPHFSSSLTFSRALRLCFKHKVFHPPMAFLRSPFLTAPLAPEVYRATGCSPLSWACALLL